MRYEFRKPREGTGKTGKNHKCTCHSELVSESHEMLNQVQHDTKITAFTLAETLITLAIIGIIAALTVPNLLIKYQKHVLKTQFFRSYNRMSAVIDRMNAEIGNVNEQGYNKDTFWPALKHYLKYQQEFYTNGGWGCATNNYKNFTNTMTYHSNCSGTLNAALTLDDGSTVWSAMTNDKNALILLQIDVNGKDKKPNRAGYDMFAFYVNKNNKFTPFSEKTTKADFSPTAKVMHYLLDINAYGGIVCNSGSTRNNGMGCAAHALLENDYFDKLKF